MEWWWGLVLLGLVAALIGMELASNAAMKKLGVTPAPSVRWLRIANLTAVVLVIILAIWFLSSR
jgi:hypothetical protein